MDRIKEIEKEISELREQVIEIGNKIKSLQREQYMLMTGCKDREEITYNNKRGIITFPHSGQPQFNPYNSDGGLSKRTHSLYDWDLKRIKKII